MTIGVLFFGIDIKISIVRNKFWYFEKAGNDQEKIMISVIFLRKSTIITNVSVGN